MVGDAVDYRRVFEAAREAQPMLDLDESADERRLRKLIDHVYDAVVLFDAHGRASYVSAAIRRVLGFSEQEFSERTLLDGIHPEDRARFGQELRRVLAEPGGMLQTRFRVRNRDGHYCVVEDSAVNRLHDPDVAALVSTFRDVTAEVELQSELQHSADRLRIALAAAHALGWEWDLRTSSITASSYFLEFFGLPAGTPHTSAEDMWKVVHPDDRPATAAAWQRCLEGSGEFNFEFRGLPAGDQTRHYASLGRLTRDTDGQPERIVGVLWDVTERWRLLEEQRLLALRMQESQKLESLGVLAGGIAHDFNNLLMAIVGNLGLTQRELGDAHPSSIHLEQIEAAASRATDLCRQLLAYAGKGRFVLQRADVNRLIDDTTHLLQLAISKKAALQYKLDEQLPAVEVDVTQIRQVLMNLVMNASDALGERNGTIGIRTSSLHADRAYLDTMFAAADLPAGDYVQLEITDTGAGMSSETQARIFEPFFSTKFPGRGLGLAAVLGIVRGHRGTLKVYSEAGKGSCFKLLLPVAPGGPDASQADDTQGKALLPRGTILVVDDEAAVRGVVSRLVERLGFHTRIAENGSAAITAYREHAAEIVCVLMDLTMPGIDGVETLRQLRRIRPDVRVLLMSGYNEQSAIAGFVGRGLAGFIQKPFTFQELEQRLRDLLV